MASVGLPVAEVRERIAPLQDRLSVAAVNGPHSTVVAGVPGALDELIAACAADGVRARRIDVDYASHSADVELIEAEVLDVLAPITPRGADVPFWSTVTGEPADTAGLDAAYWYRNLRRTVEFERTTRALLDADHRLFLEISAHPVVTPGLRETIEDSGAAAAALVTLRRDEGGLTRFRAALAEARDHGCLVEAGTLFPGAARVALPTYAFEHQRFWPRVTEPAGRDALNHPMLGSAVRLARADGLVVTANWSLRTHPWLADHAVAGTVVVPGTALLEAVIRVGDEVGCGRVDELTLHAPVLVPPRGEVRIQIAVDAPDGAGLRAVTLHSSTGDGWTAHATGSLAPTGPAPAAGARTEWPPTAPRPWTSATSTIGSPRPDTATGPRSGVSAPPGGSAATSSPTWPCRTRTPAPSACTPRCSTPPCTRRRSARCPPSAGPGCRSPGPASRCTPPARPRCACGSPEPARTPSPSPWPTPPGTRSPRSTPWPYARSARPPHGRSSARPCSRSPGRPCRRAAPPLGDYTLVRGTDPVGVLADLQASHDRLVVVTEGGASDAVTDLDAAAVWGLVRSAQSENPDRITIADLDGSPASLAALPGLIATGEPQLVVRRGEGFVPRLERVGARLTIDDPARPWRLDIPAKGTVDNLAIVPAPDTAEPLGPGEVRIAVRAAGLNFRDVLNVLGMYPGGARFLGSEAAGVVLEVAGDVTGLAPGDRVTGMITGGIGTHAVADHRLLTTFPAHWTFAQAAAVPVVFLTAYYALHDLARPVRRRADPGARRHRRRRHGRHPDRPAPGRRRLRHRERAQAAPAARRRLRRRPHRRLPHAGLRAGLRGRLRRRAQLPG
nr:hypothetical protein GCM10020092_032160 [Actinoplanes digitatis]